MNTARRFSYAALRRWTTSVLCAVATIAPARTVFSTYSIVGVDTARREAGGSGTSCLGGQDVYIIYRSAPGIGVVHAQAALNLQGRERALSLLTQGLAPEEIVEALTDASFDRQSSLRQYAVADISGRAAAFTGSDTGRFAADRQGTREHFVYSVQGNILTGERVLAQAAAAFEANGCDLAERLMRSLEAGAENGEGDSRCTDEGIPADSAFIQVDRDGETAGAYLSLRVPSSGDENPLPQLRALFTHWRATHPCPTPSLDGGTDSADAGTKGVERSSDRASCACRSAGHPPATSLPLAVVLLACAGRRRRHSPSSARPLIKVES